MNLRRLVGVCLVLPWALAGGETLPFSAAREVLVRFAGAAVADRFAFVRSADRNRAVVDAKDGKIRISAPNENLAAAAVGRYVREVAKGHFSRSGNRVPTVWPLPPAPLAVRRSRPQLHAYNYCVFSYSFAFYDESDWRANIDRLALAGFNSALVMAGNARVWQLFLRDAGFSERQIADFIADEIGISWTNCGGMEGLGAPVPGDAIEREARLGRFIVREMRRLGIEPMLQGFTGLLPNSSFEALTKERYPDVRLLDQGLWAQTYKRPILLDATTETYARLAKLWYRRLFEVYGISDPKCFVGNLFSEGGIAEDVDCPAIAAAMQRNQQLASPGALWCISCWGDAPRQDLLDGLDPTFARIIVLDRNMANGGVFPRSFGKMTWLWGELLNFGNNDGLYGGVDALVNLHRHGTGPNESTLHGYAFESEGLDSNPWFYELMTDLVFRPDLLQGENRVRAWLSDYALRRYGTGDERLVRAMELLWASVWRTSRQQEGCNETVFCARPSWQVKKSSSWATDLPPYYAAASVEKAARLYLSVVRENPALLGLETFRFDFTDLFRQVLSDRGGVLVPRLRDDADARAMFLSLIDGMDALLACDDHFRLDVREARIHRRAGERGVQAFRRMLTSWTDGTRSPLNDYAHRQYSGLLSGYYAVRWRTFFGAPETSEAALDRLMKEVRTKPLPAAPAGDLQKLAERILQTDTCCRN